MANIPGWLEEHCFRLRDDGFNVRNLNLNIRRLSSPAMIVFLSEALKENKRIETVNMTSSLTNTQRYKDAEIIFPLADAIRRHVSLRTLHLSYNRLRDVSSLALNLEMNQSSLTELYLDHNRLGLDTAIALARVIQRNDKLAEIGRAHV